MSYGMAMMNRYIDEVHEALCCYNRSGTALSVTADQSWAGFARNWHFSRYQNGKNGRPRQVKKDET